MIHMLNLDLKLFISHDIYWIHFSMPKIVSISILPIFLTDTKATRNSWGVMCIHLGGEYLWSISNSTLIARCLYNVIHYLQYTFSSFVGVEICFLLVPMLYLLKVSALSSSKRGKMLAKGFLVSILMFWYPYLW